jgi:hypothetical protein
MRERRIGELRDELGKLTDLAAREFYQAVTMFLEIEEVPCDEID